MADRYLVFDTETTNLIQNTVAHEKHQPHIIEFSGIIIDAEGDIKEELDFIVDPGVPIPPEVTKITGFRPEDVVGKPKFDEMAEQCAGFIERADAIVAHNLSYDWNVLNFEFARADVECAWPMIRICTVEETEWLNGYRLNLNALHEHLFGETFEGAHRARADVDALARCFVELKARDIV